MNIFVDWALGHSINNNSEMRYFMNTFANNYTLIDEVKQCWKQPGDNTKYARFTANDPDDGNANFSRTSNVFNYKGDYLCIREISLQYNVPTNKLTKLGIQNLAITLAGNNLHYFTAVKGVSYSTTKVITSAIHPRLTNNAKNPFVIPAAVMILIIGIKMAEIAAIIRLSTEFLIQAPLIRMPLCS